MRKALLTLTAVLFPFVLSARERAFADEPPQVAQATAQPPAVPTEMTSGLEDEHPGYENYSSLVLDWGLVRMRNAPESISPGMLSSRFIDIGLFYNIPLGQTGITASPGIGLGYDTYKLSDESGEEPGVYTLKRARTSRRARLVPVGQLLDDDKNASSFLDTRYLDFIFEMRINTNAKYPKEGFFAAIGFKLGSFLGAHTTLHYQEDEQRKERIDKESFHIEPLRYGWQTRLGWKRFGLKYTQILSGLFDNQGPKSGVRPHSLAVSVDLF